jgi:hypothetical protein
MDVETCPHPACSCAVSDSRFCSKHCEQASKDVAKHRRDREAGRRRAPEDARRLPALLHPPSRDRRLRERRDDPARAWQGCRGARGDQAPVRRHESQVAQGGLTGAAHELGPGGAVPASRGYGSTAPPGHRGLPAAVYCW